MQCNFKACEQNQVRGQSILVPQGIYSSLVAALYWRLDKSRTAGGVFKGSGFGEGLVPKSLGPSELSISMYLVEVSRHFS